MADVRGCDTLSTNSINLKHSSGDLHSRLKTRKLLGVGETDDGDVHRSKLSQILGHSDQLYIKLPPGLRLWQFVMAAMFSFLALWALLFPKHLFETVYLTSDDHGSTLSIRLYGSTLLSLALVFWSTLQCVDRDIIRLSLIASIVYFGLQVIVSALCSPLAASLSLRCLLLMCVHLGLASLSSYFYWIITGEWRLKDLIFNSRTRSQ